MGGGWEGRVGERSVEGRRTEEWLELAQHHRGDVPTAMCLTATMQLCLYGHTCRSIIEAALKVLAARILATVSSGSGSPYE